MRRAHIDAENCHGGSLRLVGRLAIVALLGTVGLLAVGSDAFASTPLSSIILSETEPGLVAAAPGPDNGPITQSNIALVTGGGSQNEKDFGQSLADGSLTASLRAWGAQPANGEGVVIIAFQFVNASDENSFLSGLNGAAQSQTGAVAFAVPGIPGAAGAEVHQSASGTPLTAYQVYFEKGNLIFEVEVASTSGQLTSTDAVSLANRQFAVAPDTPASAGSGHLDLLRLILVPAGLVLIVAVVVIGRKRKYPPSLTGRPHQGGNGIYPASAPPGPWSQSPPSPGPSSDTRPKVGVDQWQ